MHLMLLLLYCCNVAKAFLTPYIHTYILFVMARLYSDIIWKFGTYMCGRASKCWCVAAVIR